MKTVFIFILLFPLWLAAQTVHLDGKKIEYKGDVALQDLSDGEIFSRAKAALQAITHPVSDLSVD
jgi:hypothetical protein